MVLSGLDKGRRAIAPRVRILYLGLPLGAEVLRRAGFSPTVACVGHLDAPGKRRLSRSMRGLVLGKPDLEDPVIVRTLASAEPDALLSWFWPRRIPAVVLALPRRGSFGVHPSLLPRWRGPDPYFWAIRTGDRETGVTLHRLEPEYDTGAVVSARRVSIRDGENAWQLARRLDRPSLALLVECAQRLAAGEVLAGDAQDPALATSAPPPDEGALTIDWTADAADVVRLVRAAAPAPGAAALFEESLVVVEEAEETGERPPGGLAVGEGWRAGATICVRCGRGAVAVRAVLVEDAEGLPRGTRLRGAEIGRLLGS